MRDGYAVQVLYLGEPILTIERSCLAGKSDLSDEDTAAIRDAAEHLTAFVGPPREPCNVCGHVGPCADDCPCKGMPF